MEAKDNFIIFHVSGGIGKNILATAVVKAIKREYPDWNIIVLTAWKDVWLYNPHVYRSYVFQQSQFFYADYILNKNVLIFALEPYMAQDYLLKRDHLIRIWCQMCGVAYENETPEIFFNSREIEYVKNNYVRNEPILLIQTHGGGQSDIKHSWMRDMPIDIAQEVVEQFRGEVRLMHVRRDDQLALRDTEQFKGGIRELLVLIRESRYRFFIDSMCQHGAMALEKKSLVCWIRNNPNILGYKFHDNYVTEAEDQINTLDWSVLEPYDISGQVAQCPFKEGTKLFDVDKIVQAIRTQ